MGSTTIEATVVEICGVVPWAQHLASRWDEAKQVLPIPANASLKSSNAQAVLPVDPDLRSTILSGDPLATLPGYLHQLPRPSGWHRHEELIDSVALALLDRFHGSALTLLCEGGYSRVGDAYLVAKRHLTYEGLVLYDFLFDGTANAEQLAAVLRSGLSFRFVGCIVSKVELPTTAPSGFFLCDFLGGDTLGWCEFDTSMNR